MNNNQELNIIYIYVRNFKIKFSLNRTKYIKKQLNYIIIYSAS